MRNKDTLILEQLYNGISKNDNLKKQLVFKRKTIMGFTLEKLKQMIWMKKQKKI